MKFQNLFSLGTVNTDSEARFVEPNELIDAENFFVTTVDGSNLGVGKNALGNVKKTNNNIVGGKNHGTGVDSTNNLIYNIVKGTNHDYIIEYDTETTLSVIVLQSTTGTRLNLKDGERVLNVEVVYNEKPYNPITKEGGNLLKLSGDSNPPRIININRAKTWGVDGFTAEEIMLIKAPPLYPPSVTLIRTFDEKENFIKDKMISFATRFKYKDNYYSAISTWQEYSFSPDRFDLEISACENKGMVNLYNGCDITFNTGTREVIAIDLLFKESNSSVVYRVDQFIKTEESWGDNITIPTPIRFTNNKVLSVLPEDQYFRSFDNVPESAVASDIAGNRAFFANYIEGKNLIDKNGDPVVMDYIAGFTSLSPVSTPLAKTKLTATSIFDASTIVDGKIRLNFSASSLKSGSAISILFNIKSIAVTPPLTPARPIAVFDESYVTVLNKDYSSMADLIADDSENLFKSGIEGFFSDYFKDTFLVLPPDSLGFPPSIFNGFTVALISSNVIEITFPSMKYEIEALPTNTFVTEYFQDSITTAFVDSIASKKSMKSYRSYEIATIYRDLQGRKTTALTSEKNTFFIPLSASTSKNIPIVDMRTTMPPFWADTYKFAIKETIRTYEEIYTTDFYEDGYFRWVRLEGSSKNKVTEGDILLVKSDVSSIHSKPVTVKVLEVKVQDKDFIAGGVSEIPGLYMKIKPVGFDMKYDPDGYREFIAGAGKTSGTPSVTLSIPNAVSTGNIPQNSILSISLKSSFSHEDEFNDYDVVIVASSDYPDFQTFFNAQIDNLVFQGNNKGVDNNGVFIKSSASASTFTIQGTSNGRNTVFSDKSGFLDVKITLRTTAGFMIFEKAGVEESSGIFYETPDVFPVVDGLHVYNGTNVVNGVHSLVHTFNCFVQGNGAESYQIRDAFNEKYLSIDFNPNAVNKDGYKAENKYADITYSEVFNSSTNTNRLNEFNLSTANFKDNIEKAYGPILKIKGIETNLQVFQEDKDSFIFFEKDMLYNADGTSNLARIDNILGSQDLYIGEYGISYHPESFDIYAGTIYHTDTKRGVVLKKVNNGLFETSSQKMTNYFKKLFRDNTINRIIGKYDQYHDVYILNVKYNSTEYVTWVYSDSDNGWLGRVTFNPEDMCRVNSKFFSFKNGEIYEHNQSTGRNTFYGVESPSKFTVNFSQNPSERKVYKNLEIEGTDAWDLVTKTDIESGFVNKNQFVKQEGVFRGYMRTSNEGIDNANISVQGIGNCTISGLALNFTFPLENEISIGDKIVNLSNQLVGTIQNKTEKSLTLNAISNIVDGDYVMCAKSKSLESRGVLGYGMQVSGTLTKSTKTEIYAVNTEVVKSYT